MDDLVAWYRQQLDEDEAMARDADLGEAEWYSVSDLERGHHEGGAGLNDFDAQFIARHDPARVLREVEAKRRWLDELLRLPHYVWDGREEYGCPKATDVEIWRQIFEGDQVCNCGRDEHVDRSLRLLALPYTDRPGYLEAWRP